mmetsp:Transcript_35246/g.87531  ORF Transcript_35246/g.87531 Transcript_35246/m.87531 type:complete len:203 (-) Transcript_35246:1328-1936(-)
MQCIHTSHQRTQRHTHPGKGTLKQTDAYIHGQRGRCTNQTATSRLGMMEHITRICVLYEGKASQAGREEQVAHAGAARTNKINQAERNTERERCVESRVWCEKGYKRTCAKHTYTHSETQQGSGGRLPTGQARRVAVFAHSFIHLMNRIESLGDPVDGVADIPVPLHVAIDGVLRRLRVPSIAEIPRPGDACGVERRVSRPQ